MSSKSKTKGNANERVVAKKLTDWWGEVFLRTPNSGAMRRGGAAFEYGDLLPPLSFPGIIEAKHYEEIETDLLLKGDGTKSLIYKWWVEQTLADVKRCYDETKEVMQPLLIFKENNRQHFLCLQSVFFQYLTHIYFAKKLPYFEVFIPETSTSFTIVSLDNFLSSVTKEEFLVAAQSRSL